MLRSSSPLIVIAATSACFVRLSDMIGLLREPRELLAELRPEPWQPSVVGM